MIEILINGATVAYLFAHAFRVAAAGLARLDRLLIGHQAIKKAPPEKVDAVVAGLGKMQIGSPGGKRR